MDWLGALDQGVVSSPLRPLGRNGEEIELTTESLQEEEEGDTYQEEDGDSEWNPNDKDEEE
jgi:hypothetical protein